MRLPSNKRDTWRASVRELLVVRLLLAVGLLIVLGPMACRSEHSGPSSRRHCDDQGTVYVADQVPGSVRLRAVHLGCDACPKLERRSKAGSVCRASSVCSEVCCACPGGERKFVVSACVEGACASQTVSCEKALQQFGKKLCGE